MWRFSVKVQTRLQSRASALDAVCEQRVLHAVTLVQFANSRPRLNSKPTKMKQNKHVNEKPPARRRLRVLGLKRKYYKSTVMIECELCGIKYPSKGIWKHSQECTGGDYDNAAAKYSVHRARLLAQWQESISTGKHGLLLWFTGVAQAAYGSRLAALVCAAAWPPYSRFKRD